MSPSPTVTGTTTAIPTHMDADRLPREAGLTQAEAARVRSLVGRGPNALEWGMFGAMWSEHCAYKHSKKLLRTLPTTGPRVAVVAHGGIREGERRADRARDAYHRSSVSNAFSARA